MFLLKIKLLLFTLCYLYVIQLATAFNNPKCKGRRYMCSDNIPKKIQACVEIADDKEKQHNMYLCPQGQYCNISGYSIYDVATCVPLPEKNKTFPGEYCKNDDECYNGVCSGGICQGFTNGQTCNLTEQCSPHYYCNNNICEEQIIFGLNCTNDYQCENNCVCNLGFCAYYYSLDNDLPADNPRACASGYVENNLCKSGLRSQEKNKPKPCEKNEDCPLVNAKDQVIRYSECQCGFNAGGFSYCSLSEGDDEYLLALEKFQFVLYTNYHCHTYLRYGPCRYIYNDEYIDYHKAMKYWEMTPQVTFNDYCIQQTFTNNYWKWLDYSTMINFNKLLMIALIFIFITYNVG